MENYADKAAETLIFSAEKLSKTYILNCTNTQSIAASLGWRYYLRSIKAHEFIAHKFI